jgi:hypothetical protein
MIQPTALNVLIIGLSMVLFSFIWRMGAGYLITRNPDSPVGKAMGAVL